MDKKTTCAVFTDRGGQYSAPSFLPKSFLMYDAIPNPYKTDTHIVSSSHFSQKTILSLKTILPTAVPICPQVLHPPLESFFVGLDISSTHADTDTPYLQPSTVNPQSCAGHGSFLALLENEQEEEEEQEEGSVCHPMENENTWYTAMLSKELPLRKDLQNPVSSPTEEVVLDEGFIEEKLEAQQDTLMETPATDSNNFVDDTMDETTFDVDWMPPALPPSMGMPEQPDFLSELPELPHEHKEVDDSILSLSMPNLHDDVFEPPPLCEPLYEKMEERRLDRACSLTPTISRARDRSKTVGANASTCQRRKVQRTLISMMLMSSLSPVCTQTRTSHSAVTSTPRKLKTKSMDNLP